MDRSATCAGGHIRPWRHSGLIVAPQRSLCATPIAHKFASKNTLAGFLPRFFDPLNGRVIVDGHDVRDIHLKSLRSQITLALQESFLYPITIAKNIAYGCPDAIQEEIELAARAANSSFSKTAPLRKLAPIQSYWHKTGFMLATTKLNRPNQPWLWRVEEA